MKEAPILPSITNKAEVERACMQTLSLPTVEAIIFSLFSVRAFLTRQLISKLRISHFLRCLSPSLQGPRLSTQNANDGFITEKLREKSSSVDQSCFLNFPTD